MGFRKKHTIFRRKAGEGRYNDDGNWQAGGEMEKITIKATVQPLGMDEVDTLPEGDRAMHAVKIFTDTELFPSKQAAAGRTALEADQLVYRERLYKIVACEAYQSGVINHFKAYAKEEEETAGEIGAEEIYP